MSAVTKAADAVRPDIRAEQLLVDALGFFPAWKVDYWSPSEIHANLASYLSGVATAELELDHPRLKAVAIALTELRHLAQLVAHHELGKPLVETSDRARQAYTRSGRDQL